jgi:hypothetical protein
MALWNKATTALLSRSARVVLHHHDGLLHSMVPSVLQPGTGRGLLRFATSDDLLCLSAAQDVGDAPHNTFIPFEESPSSVAEPHH